MSEIARLTPRIGMPRYCSTFQGPTAEPGHRLGTRPNCRCCSRPMCCRTTRRYSGGPTLAAGLLTTHHLVDFLHCWLFL